MMELGSILSRSKLENVLEDQNTINTITPLRTRNFTATQIIAALRFKYLARNNRPPPSSAGSITIFRKSPIKQWLSKSHTVYHHKNLPNSVRIFQKSLIEEWFEQITQRLPLQKSTTVIKFSSHTLEETRLLFHKIQACTISQKSALSSPGLTEVKTTTSLIFSL